MADFFSFQLFLAEFYALKKLKLCTHFVQQHFQDSKKYIPLDEIDRVSPEIKEQQALEYDDLSRVKIRVSRLSRDRRPLNIYIYVCSHSYI